MRHTPTIITLVTVMIASSTAWGQVCKPTQIPASAPASRFTENPDGTETDSRTGLIWERCALGQIWSATERTCGGPATTYTWQQALAEAAARPGWRLPNIKELESIVERQCYGPAINLTVFPNAPNSPVTDWTAGEKPQMGYWSGTPYTLDCCLIKQGTSEYVYDEVWFLDAYDGATHTVIKTNRNFVRLVKGGP